MADLHPRMRGARLAGVALMVLLLWLWARPGAVAQQGSTGVAAGPAAGALEEYRLGPGDELSLTFPYNAELNHDGPVGPDGRFTVPVLGSVAVAGKTPTEAATQIATALRDAGIVANAVPSLTVRRYGSNVYVAGQVRLPGVVQLAAGMDALQAIIAAGGATDAAKAGQVAIIRRTADNHSRVLYVDVKGYLKGRQNADIALLQPRDIVFVPRTRIAEVDLWIDNYINKTLPFSRGLNYSYGNYPVTTVVK